MCRIIVRLSFISVFISLVSAQIYGCPPGLNNVTALVVANEKHCFYFAQHDTTFNLAQNDCARYGGNLATVPDNETHVFLYQQGLTLIDKGEVADRSHYWLGGTVKRADRRHTWTTGENSTFTNWNTGYPNPREDEECILMAFDSEGTWIHSDCNRAVWFYGYICSYERNSAVPCFSKGSLLMAIVSVLLSKIYSTS